MCHFPPHSEVKCVDQFEMHHITSWTFVYMQGDSSILETMAAHCRLKGLELVGYSKLVPILNGVKDNCSIAHIHVKSEPVTIHACNYSISFRVCTCMYMY